jgi:rhamnogalacturonyl hydrolase YesR
LFIFWLNSGDYIKKSFFPIKLLNEDRFDICSDIILKRSLAIVAKKRALMSFSDDESLYSTLSKCKGFLRRRGRPLDYAYFNFPLAFLLNGLLEIGEKQCDTRILSSVEGKCQELLGGEGELKFLFDKVDQAYFGCVFIKLYELTGKEKYLLGARTIYNNILAFVGDDQLLRYRPYANALFVDTLGLVCPFLCRYSNITQCPDARELAIIQIDYYLQRGFEPISGLPFHALDLDKNLPLGPVNWSRGVGWYLIGLSELVQCCEGAELERFKTKLHEIYARLNTLKVDDVYWAQFLGHTNDQTIDSSATLMFLYALSRSGHFQCSTSQLTEISRFCIDKKGFVVNASGDTIYINKYSRSKGASELAQGLMLSLIASQE